MATGDTEIMQAAGDLHHQIRHALFGQPQHIFDNPAAFHTRDDMFDHYPDTGDYPIQEPLPRAQVPAPGFFFGCRVSVPGGS